MKDNNQLFDSRIKKFLDKHGYQLVLGDNIVEIRYAQQIQNFIVVMGIIFTFIFSIIGLVKPHLGFTSAILSMITAIILSQHVRGSLVLSIDLMTSRIKITNQLFTAIENIDQIALDSNFTNEYSSADKQTSEVYTHRLTLIAVGGRPYKVFEFEEDYVAPSEGLEAFYNALKKVLATSEM